MAAQVPAQSPVLDEAVARRLDAHLEAVHQRLDALDRRLDQRLAELRAKQDEELMLIKAMTCQLRGRVERAERRHPHRPG